MLLRIVSIIKKLKKRKNPNILKGIPYAKTVLKPESGFFLLIDFTELKKQGIINNEKELLKLLYEQGGIKFLVGQSFSWPYEKEIIMRITYALEEETLIETINSISEIIGKKLKK